MMMSASSPLPTTLPLLENILEAVPHAELPALASVAFVCVQHLFATTVHLLESVVKLGASPENIHVMGKSYSFSPLIAEKIIKLGGHCYANKEQQNLGEFEDCFKEDIAEMWESIYADLKGKNIKLIVVLDDGGICLTNIPRKIQEEYSLVGIEQTSSGLTKISTERPLFPIVEVASSAAKHVLESPMIAEAVVEKLETFLPSVSRALTCAVVGAGSIGKAVSHKLIELSHSVVIYDLDNEKVKGLELLHTDTLTEALAKSDYVFGCSGTNITENFPLECINNEKTFMSCSSGDVEFCDLLKVFEQKGCSYRNVLDHLNCEVNGHPVRIIRGGFPVNLDNSGLSVEGLDIQLTRGLLLGGILQAIDVGFSFSPSDLRDPKRYMLSPTLQSFIASHWDPRGVTRSFALGHLNLFQDLDWIRENSGGEYMGTTVFESWFRPIDEEPVETKDKVSVA